MRKKWLLLLVSMVIAVGLLAAGCGQKNNSTGNGEKATAAKYPTKPIQIIVPMPAGGPSDITARAMEKVSQKYLGQPLIVVNKPGGAGSIGFNELVEAKPDGYTLGLVATNLILQPLYGGTKYNYPQVVEPIAQAVTVPIVLAVPADKPWKNLAEFIDYAKKHPGEIKYAYTNVGSLPHVTSGMFVKDTGIKIEPVPFQGSADSLAAFMGGNVQAIFIQLSDIKKYIKDGKVRLLAISTEKRLSDLNDVPTFKEQGFNIVTATWFGVGGPKGLPENVKTKLAEGFKNIINDETFKNAVTNIGMYVNYVDQKELPAKWKSESELYAKVVKDTGIAEQIAKQQKK